MEWNTLKKFLGKYPQGCEKMYKTMTTVAKMSWNCLKTGFMLLFSSLRSDCFPKNVWSPIQDSNGFKIHLENMFSNENVYWISWNNNNETKEINKNCKCKSAVKKQKQCFPEIVPELCTVFLISAWHISDGWSTATPENTHKTLTRQLHYNLFITTYSIPHWSWTYIIRKQAVLWWGVWRLSCLKFTHGGQFC